MIRVAKRTFAFAFVALGAIAWAGLTTAAIVTTPPSTETADVTSETNQIAAWQQLSPDALAGIGWFRQENCKACHPPGGRRGIGPDLTHISAQHRNAAWMIPHFKNPAAVVPGSSMPPVQLTDAQLNSLSEFILKLNPQNESELHAAPEPVVQGAMLYQVQHCGSCHMVNGVGMKVGPPLNGVSAHRDRAWLEEHFLNPQKMSPGSPMPAYKFNAQDMDHMIQFLLSLPPAPAPAA